MAATFRSLHNPQDPLRLSNAWDVASARIVEAAGAKAIATTSAGVAWSLGSADGSVASRELVIQAVARIVAAVHIPVTADIENGYCEEPADIAETIRGIVQAGAVGINIEDQGLEPGILAEKIRLARQEAKTLGVELFINARTDVFLIGKGSETDQVAETIERSALYLAAGADGIFVPGAVSAEAVAGLVQGIAAPVNIMVGPGSLTVEQLTQLGVARVSLGSAVAQASLQVVKRAAEELMSSGSYASTEKALDYGELNSLLAGQ